MLIRRKMDKVWSPHAMVHYSATKKGRIIETCYHVDEFPNNYAMRKKPDPKKNTDFVNLSVQMPRNL